MFGKIGSFDYRMRYTVIAVLVALMGGLGLFGLDLGKHLSQSGWFDEGSESVQGSKIADAALGRDHKSDVLLIVTPPKGTNIDDPAVSDKVEEVVEGLLKAYPDVVTRDSPSEEDPGAAGLIDPFQKSSGGAGDIAATEKQARMWNTTPGDDGRTRGFVSIGVRGDDDTTILANYKEIEPFFHDLDQKYDAPGYDFQLAGLQPVAGAMADGMDNDIKRAEIIALPVVALMLLFVFGGVVAAVLPVFIGGLTIAGSLGIMKILALTTELNVFAQSVVTLIGLGIAIDYGLFIVSRFREELAEGYTTEAAVRRSVQTAGQTVVFSATIIVAALACLLIFPQAFLKSVAYGAIASVTLAAFLSITVLPAILAILGPRIDALSVPFLNRTKTKEEIETGFWGKLAGWVMQHPVKTAVPTTLLLLALIIPFGNIAFGGISEKFLPPNNENRIAQETFDEYFPAERTEAVKLVVLYDPNDDEATTKLETIAEEASAIPGFTKPFTVQQPDGTDIPWDVGEYGDYGVTQMTAGLVNRNTAAEAIKELRGINNQGMRIFVAGTPTLTQDSIDSLMKLLPFMAIMLVLVTGFLMFLAFGSLILPIKAALMTALGLGATLGILTWMFVGDPNDPGFLPELLNYTPGPLFAAVLVLIISIIYGLSTDYEIFLLSRMVEARQQGASTTEAIRVGTAHTGGIITAAAAILVVVTGAFGLSEIVMMKYIAFGMIAALILDATVIRMFLVPSVMKLLGDDCWWAPKWMVRMQQKIGLGETVLEDEPENKVTPVFSQGSVSAGGVVAVAEAPTTAMKAMKPRTSSKTADADDDVDVDVDERPAAGQAEPRGVRLTNPFAQQEIDDDHLAEGHLEDLVDEDDDQEVGPNTGSWSLGAGGVRLKRDHRPRQQAPAPAPAQAPAPQQPRAPRPAPQPMPQRPAQPAPGQGRPPAAQPVRPVAPPLSPQPQPRPAPPAAPAPQPAPQAPVPPPAEPEAPVAPPVGRPGYLASTPPPESPPTPAMPPQYGRPNRQFSDDRDDQISVQELLRRSRSQDD